eukprot:6017914-Prymnesium_polylepis.2
MKNYNISSSPFSCEDLTVTPIGHVAFCMSASPSDRSGPGALRTRERGESADTHVDFSRLFRRESWLLLWCLRVFFISFCAGRPRRPCPRTTVHGVKKLRALAAHGRTPHHASPSELTVLHTHTTAQDCTRLSRLHNACMLTTAARATATRRSPPVACPVRCQLLWAVPLTEPCALTTWKPAASKAAVASATCESGTSVKSVARPPAR